MTLEKELPKWENTGVEPPASKKTEGWQPDEKPPAGWFNWFFNRIYEAVKEIQQKLKPVALSGKYEDLTDKPNTFPATAHKLGSSVHTADTLANLNAKISDATLDDKDDTRTPKKHGNEAHNVAYVAKNDDITAGTFSKVTVDAKGLVLNGATADISDVDGLEDALNGTVKTTGNQSIDGYIKFVRGLESRSGRVAIIPASGTGNYVHLDVSSESDDYIGMSVQLRNVTDGKGYRQWAMGVYTNGKERYALVRMRSSPGASDAVNTSYVLDRVDEMVGYVDDEVSAHEAREDNPHAVTKEQVGLGSYPTSPADIGIPTAVQTALDGKVPYLTGSTFGGGIELHRMLRLKYVNVGDVEFNRDGVGRHHMIRADGDKLFVVPVMGGVLKSTAMSWHRGSDDVAYTWCNMRSSPGASDVVNTKYVLDRVSEMVGYVDDQDALKVDEMVLYVDDEVGTHAGRTDNPHEVTKAQVGLSNVDNTSDADKPISTATQTALNAKADTTALSAKADKTYVDNGLNAKADITFVNGAIQSAIIDSWNGVY